MSDAETLENNIIKGTPTSSTPGDLNKRKDVPPKNPLLKDPQSADSPFINDKADIAEHPEDQSGG